jgi:hypothetical protein
MNSSKFSVGARLATFTCLVLATVCRTPAIGSERTYSVDLSVTPLVSAAVLKPSWSPGGHFGFGPSTVYYPLGGGQLTLTGSCYDEQPYIQFGYLRAFLKAELPPLLNIGEGDQKAFLYSYDLQIQADGRKTVRQQTAWASTDHKNIVASEQERFTPSGLDGISAADGFRVGGNAGKVTALITVATLTKLGIQVIDRLSTSAQFSLPCTRAAEPSADHPIISGGCGNHLLADLTRKDDFRLSLGDGVAVSDAFSKVELSQIAATLGGCVPLAAAAQVSSKTPTKAIPRKAKSKVNKSVKK